MATTESPVPVKVQRLLGIAAKHDTLTVTEVPDDTPCLAEVRTWEIRSTRPHEEDLIWIYWSPAANGGRTTITRYSRHRAKSGRNRKNTQHLTRSQAGIWINMLAGAY